MFDDVERLFHEYVQSADRALLLAAILIFFVILILILNACLCIHLRRRTKRELVHYPSDTLQYIPFPRRLGRNGESQKN
ncbi:unnamed protein product [Caenorhabditis auriculariae]|uniref:Uncharacterized protein n=1 Tax=Caenorhabditis auriculariae TaxID=2777116 RepID=A0A8S1GRH8_9PELO|nr:unnamed protein product [Caenorhabditis auriculariae]